MNKIISIKDLVIQTITNDSEIKNKANSGDPIGCYQMGVIHLLGINTPMDFMKATQFFSSHSLSDDKDAIRLLGFIAELEGKYSQAFQYYAQTENSENDSFLDKVIKGRNHIQDYLRRLDLPISLNSELSSILNDYSKDKISKTEASIKVAAICNDEQSYLEAAKNLYEAKDYISAIQWLKKGKVAVDNAIYASINERFEKSKEEVIRSKVIQVVDLNCKSLLSNEDPTPFLNKIKKLCDEASRNCSSNWKEKAKSFVDTITRDYKDKERKAYFDALAEDEARKSKRRNIICGIIAGVVFLVALVVMGLSSDEKVNRNEPTNKDVVTSDNRDANTNKDSRALAQEDIKDKRESSSTYRESVNSGYDNFLSERRLSDNDLSDKTKRELEIMRNSIYARYGYKFKREDLLNHFSQYSWYNPTTSDMGAVYNMMNDNEKYNVDFIKKHE